MTTNENAVQIERFHLQGNPLPPLDFGRLPPPEQFRGMELAYRPDDLISEIEGERLMRSCLAFAIAIPVLTSLSIWFSSQWVPLTGALHGIEGMSLMAGTIGTMVATALLLAYGFLLSRTAQLTLAAALLPAATTTLLLIHHAPAALALRIVLGLLLVLGLPPVQSIFTSAYADWLLADPRLTSEQRKTIIVPASRLYPIPALLIIVAVFTAGTLTVIGSLCLFALLLPGATAIAKSRHFLQVFLLPDLELPAPGLWTPATSALLRLPMLAVLAALCYAAAALAVRNIWMPFAILLAPVIGNLLLVGIMRPVLNALPKMSDTATQLAQANEDRTWCECQVDRLRSSHHVAVNPKARAEEKTIREAEHLFLGIDPSHQQPILLPEKLLARHVYIVGMTGSGKTSIGVTLLLIQIIRGHHAN